MTVGLGENAILFIGACGVEEVEPLVTFLESHPDFAIDLSRATTIHTALWQALMVFKRSATFPSNSELETDKVLEALATYFDQGRQA